MAAGAPSAVEAESPEWAAVIAELDEAAHELGDAVQVGPPFS